MNRYLYIVILLVIALVACSGEGTTEDDAKPDSEREIREYNLEIQREQAEKRTPCDAISIEEFILENYEEGSYLVEFDKTYTFSLQKPAVIKHKTETSNLVFAVIAKSKPGERPVEKENIVGYESSFINLDSTKLGTAFFFLTMFECFNEQLVPVWEAEVPRHGGFNYMKMGLWQFNSTPFITLNFEDGIISGHRDYNYFFIDGFFERPHLLETYEGLVHKRTMQNFDNDKYPDYYEYRFIDSLLQIVDSIPFKWDEKRKVYRSPVNRRWIRKY